MGRRSPFRSHLFKLSYRHLSRLLLISNDPSNTGYPEFFLSATRRSGHRVDPHAAAFHARIGPITTRVSLYYRDTRQQSDRRGTPATYDAACTHAHTLECTYTARVAALGRRRGGKKGKKRKGEKKEQGETYGE